MFQILGLLSLISILFGILVILHPETIAWLVGGFFILSGIIGLGFIWQTKGLFDNLRKR